MSVTSLSIDATRTAPTVSDALYRMTKLHYFSAAARARRERFQQALRELNSMSWAELAELGFVRSDIERVANEMADMH